MNELPKNFDPAVIETRWYAHWEQQGLFRPARPGAQPWTIVNPPPNVTGTLHIGHALDNTLQDILVRHARLQGKDALWVVGTDHAGIATQTVVERNLAKEGIKRTDLGREEFLARVWQWKEQSGNQITRQLRRLGCSMDWANERFTMDEGFSAAVLKLFVDLYREGLIYRDKRLVNWDAGLGTAISDLEVETREVQGKFWHLTYPLADGSGAVSVATTRPETMLADMAVAVHPRDERYTALIGREVRLPITGRLIPIVADEYADPELGSGAVKITPGHDFNDFNVGLRAGIATSDMLSMLDATARVCQTADGLVPASLIHLDRFEARKVIVRMLEESGALERVEDRAIQTPYGDRSGVVIEPRLTDQWYVDAKTMAQPAIEAVRTGRIKIVPAAWEKTFFLWMENIQPWCVSRQLWWGHQIPAWFADDGRVFVARNEKDARDQAGAGVALTRDPDVLDTWFSSSLWPFATLGWPGDHDPALGGRYPNDVLVSGFDLIFFWNARMMMQGLHSMKEVPFRTLYMHGLVRAADGSKMSKSKGNAVDPLGLIDTYGADAVRFFMAAMETQGRDIKMDERRIEGYRNLATKLWNAARFAQANQISAAATLEPPRADLVVNQWIIAETVRTVQEIDTALASYRFDSAANTIYQFIWNRFCDWYLELIKPVLQRDEAGSEETRATAGWVIDQILVLLHPFMPFITEELWHAMGARNHALIIAKWPVAEPGAVNPEAEREIDWLIRLISEIRVARSELNVPLGARLSLFVRDASEETLKRVDRQSAALARLARVERSASAVGGSTAQVVVDEATFVLSLEGVIDLDAERARLIKTLAAAEKERDTLGARLDNPSFVERARPDAVEKARADYASRQAEAVKLQSALRCLGES